MSRHTSGPWNIGRCDEYVFEVCGRSGKERVALCYGSTLEAVEDNTYLIAAAPELLDACVAALKLLRNCAFTENQPTLTQVRRAIAKAQRESNE